MFLTKASEVKELKLQGLSRNPLKSGQCFLLTSPVVLKYADAVIESQSPQIGSMFLTDFLDQIEAVDLAMSQSPQIGSMFLTQPVS